MIIFPSSRYNVDRLLERGIFFALVGLVGLLPLSLCVLFLFGSGGAKEGGALRKEVEGRALSVFAYEAIGTGSLTLNPRHPLGWVSRIAEELVLIAYNSRPDALQKDVTLLFSLKSSKEQLSLTNGKVLGLKESEQGKGFSASGEESSLWIKPILLDDGSVLIEAGRKFSAEHGQTAEERGEFVISRAGAFASKYHPGTQNFIQELKSAKCYQQDLLIERYGGAEFSSWGKKYKLEFQNGSSTYARFVSSGDYLVYQGGEWDVSAIPEGVANLPLAKIRAVSAKGIEIEGWDEGGFYSAHIKLELESPARLLLKPETLPTSIRLRSGTQVSCLFGKKRVIIKQGDWILRTPSGWKNLRRADEIENCLFHRLKGELFIFDAIEKEYGELVMKGHLFDETRTQVQPMHLPIEGEKREKKKVRRR